MVGIWKVLNSIIINKPKNVAYHKYFVENYKNMKDMEEDFW